jgi:hypothetical protein
VVACRLAGTTDLGAVREERGLLVVGINGLGVPLDGGGPVLVLEGLVALVFELGGFSRRTPHGVAGVTGRAREGAVEVSATGRRACGSGQALFCWLQSPVDDGREAA